LPNSNAASSAFQAAPAGPILKTIDFESVPLTVGDHPISLGDGVTLTFTNANTGTPFQTAITNSTADPSVFNTTPGGANFLEYANAFAAYPGSQTAVATFTFSSAVYSFGADLTGLFGENDPTAPFQYSYQFNDGSAQSIALHGPNTSTASTAGFYGFTDTNAFSSVSLVATITNNDPTPNRTWTVYVGVDDVTYSTPEPGSLMLLGSGMAVLAACWRKRAR
jgi:hypothetical protein